MSRAARRMILSHAGAALLMWALAILILCGAPPVAVLPVAGFAGWACWLAGGDLGAAFPPDRFLAWVRQRRE